MDRGDAVSRLEGLEDIERNPSGEPYEPGKKVSDHKLVSTILHYFLDPENSANSFTQEHYKIMIRDAELGENFDHQQFLDAIVNGLHQHRIESEEQGRHEPNFHFLQYMFNPILKGLYDRGFNNFHLDLSDFPELFWMGAQLYGTEDNHFVLYYKGEVHTFGSDCTHARIFAEGPFNHVGGESLDSKFTFSEAEYSVGLKAERCAFHIDTGNPYTWIQDIAGKHLNEDVPKGCEFYFEKGIEDSDDVIAYSTIVEWFSGHGNTFLIPDGSGGWEEVKP